MTEYILIINLSWDININTNHCKLDQTLANLTDTIPLFRTEGVRLNLLSVSVICNDEETEHRKKRRARDWRPAVLYYVPIFRSKTRMQTTLHNSAIPAGFPTNVYEL
jgi:hypothetical protein